MLFTPRLAFGKTQPFKSFLTLILIGLFALNLNAQCVGGISSFPYSEDFEINDGGWVSGGTASDWVYGQPAKPLINTASSGIMCWMIGQPAASFYNYGERSYLQSPCFDMSSLVKPYIQFDVFWELERQYDGASLQYSLDGGLNWSNVGSFGDATDCLNQNWFNTTSINGLSGLTTVRNGWTGNIQSTMGSCQGGGGSNGWLEARHTMPYLAGRNNVIFRFIFGSGTTCNDYDGFAFDNISIGESPSNMTLTATSTYETCFGADASITLSPVGGQFPYSYSWQPAISTGPTASNLVAGVYVITVTDDLGCNRQSTVTIPKSPTISGTIQSKADTCLSSRGSASITINVGTPPFTYLWSTGQNTTSVTGLLAGSYDVTVTDSAGCTKIFTSIVEDYAALSLNLGPDQKFCPAGAFSLSSPGFASYLWNTGDTLFQLPLSKAGIYWLSVTDDKGCVASDTIEVFEDCLNDVIIPNAFSPNGDFVNDTFNAIGILVENFSMEIYDRWGKQVYLSKVISEGWDGKNKSEECPQGVYVWKVSFEDFDKNVISKRGTVTLIR